MQDLIYNQHEIPADQWLYGFRPSSATGCGWIATHNALHLLGFREEIPDLIRYYESQLPLIHGNLGTSFWGPVVCFRKWGFPVDVILDPGKFDPAAKAVPVCILFYHWRQGPRFGAHFAALRWTEEGFLGYNTFRNSHGPDPYGPSLREFLKEHRYFSPVLLCIHRRSL